MQKPDLLIFLVVHGKEVNASGITLLLELPLTLFVTP